MDKQERGFDLNQHIEEFVINFLKSNEIKDAVKSSAQDILQEQIKDITALKKEQALLNEDFDEFEDRLNDCADEIIDLRDDTEKLNVRVDNIENKFSLQCETDELHDKIDDITKLFNKYKPILDLLNTAAPMLKKLGLVKNSNSIFNKNFWYYQQPQDKPLKNTWSS